MRHGKKGNQYNIKRRKSIKLNCYKHKTDPREIFSSVRDAKSWENRSGQGKSAQLCSDENGQLLAFFCFPFVGPMSTHGMLL